MRIATTHEDGQIYRHFGRTPEFKLFDVKDGAVASTAVIANDAEGHGAIVGLLAEQGVDAVICAGIGAPAQEALRARGIALHAQASGSADEAVAALLAGKLPETTEPIKHEGGCCHAHRAHE